jgi:hypothetical protein
MCLIWIGCVMLFFTLSTTHEYYSMPIYPAFALLLGLAMTGESKRIRTWAKVASVITALALLACWFLLIRSWHLPAPGDISDALSKNPDVYTLALGHVTDLTFAAFAYLRLPLALAAVAFCIGTAALWLRRRLPMFLGVALMLMLFFQAARLALVAFDPYLSSYALADALNRMPKGVLIFNGQYYDFSAVPFYSNYQPLLLNGRVNNLEYGSYAPDAPQVFIDDNEFVKLWNDETKSRYVITYDEKLEHLRNLVGPSHLIPLARSGGKQLLTNRPPAQASS